MEFMTKINTHLYIKLPPEGRDGTNISSIFCSKIKGLRRLGDEQK